MSRRLRYGCRKIITNSDDGGAPVSQMEWIFFIGRAIQERGGVTVRAISSTFEVSERQVKRDIEYLRFRLGTPVELSALKHQYI
jgi:predicted DNA-binding transcriptional regulator YafY